MLYSVIYRIVSVGAEDFFVIGSFIAGEEIMSGANSRNSIEYFLQHEAKDIINRYLQQDGFSFDELMREIWNHFPKGHHPLDMMDGFGSILDNLAEFCPKILIQALSDESIPADPTRSFIASSLGRIDLTDEVIDALSQAASHKNPFLRRSAVRSLLKLEDNRAWGVLQERLKDRSGIVSQCIWDTMTNPDFFDYPYGIKALRRNVADEEFKQYNHREWSRQEQILLNLEARPHNARRRRRKPKATSEDPSRS